tara:strand:- start:669 stop:1163 length:495 start_codon:yes stop_codon:yes gene_type:complete
MQGCCAEVKKVGSYNHPSKIQTKTLSTGGQLFVWSARRWLIAAQKKEQIEMALAHPYRTAKCPGAAKLLDEIMSILAVSSFRSVTIRCLHCPVLDNDEWLLIQILRKLQTNDEKEAARLVDEFMRGALATTFLRAANLYATSLSNVGKPITRITFLRLIENQNF